MLCGSLWNLANHMKKQSKKHQNAESIGEKLKNKGLMSFVSFFHVFCKISNFHMWTVKHLVQASCTELTLIPEKLKNSTIRMVLLHLIFVIFLLLRSEFWQCSRWYRNSDQNFGIPLTEAPVSLVWILIETSFGLMIQRVMFLWKKLRFVNSFIETITRQICGSTVLLKMRVVLLTKGGFDWCIFGHRQNT